MRRIDFSAIDWQRPWLSHLRELGHQLAVSPDWIATATELARERGLNNAAGLPVVFVPQDALPNSIGYEAHISATGQVPTRDNLHDFFNALIWLHFPLTKRTLNQLQAQEIHRQPQKNLRGRQRDAATLFDENAALFISKDPAKIAFLKCREWRALLFSDARNFHSECTVILFGHALLEKLIHPYKAITAHVWSMPSETFITDYRAGFSLAEVDDTLASSIASGFTSHDFSHLPVLGVPGWWEGQNEAFYADAAVFRTPNNRDSAAAHQAHKKTRPSAGEET